MYFKATCEGETWPPFFKRAHNPLLSIYYDTRNVASDPAAFSVALAQGLSPKELASDKKSLTAEKECFVPLPGIVASVRRYKVWIKVHGVYTCRQAYAERVRY